MNLHRIENFLQEECHLDPGSVLAVAISGGADSVCLLHLLTQLPYQIYGLHFNHHIRPEAVADAHFVQNLCKQLSVEFRCGDGDVPVYARAQHFSIEEAARILRYQYLFATAHQVNAQAVITAHHAGDQAETILMHLIRGAGSSGLRGMQKIGTLPGFDPRIPIIRPLLDSSKQDIIAYCQENQLKYIHDSSNDDVRYFRNWLRNDLLPQIEAKNPKFQDSLNRTAQILTDDVEWMQDNLDQVWQSVLVHDSTEYLQFDYAQICLFKRGLFRGFARRAIQYLRPGLRDIDFEDIERLQAFVLKPPRSKRADLVAGLDLVLEDGILSICDHGFEIPPRGYLQLDRQKSILLPGVTRINELYSLHTEIIDLGDLDTSIWETADRMQAWLDLEAIIQPLELRFAKPGDRIELLGMGGRSTKVADVFINYKIPKSARKHYPLVCDGERIVWIPGIQISEKAKVKSSTQTKLHLQIKSIL